MNYAPSSNGQDLDLQNISVLIVEGHDLMRHLMAAALRTLGCTRVACVVDAKAAMAFLADAAPDLVIAESGTPPIDGIELAGYIRNDPSSRVPHVPIILACSRTDAVSPALARNAGVDELLVKPLSLKMLRKSICNAVLHSRPFLRTDDYFGPDRRRRASVEPDEDLARRTPVPMDRRGGDAGNRPGASAKLSGTKVPGSRFLERKRFIPAPRAMRARAMAKEAARIDGELSGQ